MSDAKSQFLTTNGPLLTLTQLSIILSRSADGIRASLYSNYEFSRLLKTARIRLGRRVYFFTEKIADIIGLS